MEICKKCENLMMPVKVKNKTILRCQKCGYKSKLPRKASFKLKEKITHDPSESIPIVEKEISTLPTTRMECNKCGNKLAWWWTQQTRSSDEPETRFYRCTNCRNTWREYS